MATERKIAFMTIKLQKFSYIKQIISIAILLSLFSASYPQVTEAKFFDWGILPATDGIANAQVDNEDIVPTTTELPVKDWVLQRIAEAGLNQQEAEVIINCESKWNPDVIGFNNNRTVDMGLWQINSIHKDISNADKLDYKKATDWAIAKRLKDGSWSAWYCSRKLARR
jgi:hypothetical protein